MKYVLTLIFSIVFFTGFSQDTITATFNKKTFTQKDTITVGVNITTHYRTTKAQTINLIIENIASHQQWKFRYPILGDTTAFALPISSSITDGTYAFNFFLQSDFFKIKGILDRTKNTDKQINYLMTFKRKETVFDQVILGADGSFKLSNMLFEDSSFIAFSPSKKKVQNILHIKPIITLDSTYTPLASCTQYIIINKPSISDTTHYTYAIPEKKVTHDAVIVVGKDESIKKKFEEEHVSPMFNSITSIDFDGLLSDDIANCTDIFLFLQAKIAGLTVGINGDTGEEELVWRKQPVTFYVNEMDMTDFFTSNTVNPSDIALIKVFRPGSYVGTKSSSGGTVSIYTKTGKYAINKNGKHHFYFKGYNGFISNWQ